MNLYINTFCLARQYFCFISYCSMARYLVLSANTYSLACGSYLYLPVGTVCHYHEMDICCLGYNTKCGEQLCYIQGQKLHEIRHQNSFGLGFRLNLATLNCNLKVWLQNRVFLSPTLHCWHPTCAEVVEVHKLINQVRVQWVFLKHLHTK